MAEEVKNTEAVAEAPAAESAPAAAPKQRGKSGRYVPSGIAYVLATFNNTKVTFTDLHGNVLCWSTGGKNAQEHGVCRAGDRRGCRKKGAAPGHEGSGSTHQGAGCRP